ncbi:MAG: ecotin family protein [Dissulfurispiraceae bacterium]|nr:ecotin family protein [Dissulfurispiraceae bacterium]
MISSKAIVKVLMILVSLVCFVEYTAIYGVCADTSVQIIDSHTSENSLDWEGVYTGITPCADCAGIRTTVTLFKNNRFTYQMQYLGKDDDRVYTDSGTFVWKKNGSVIQLSTQNSAGELPDIKVEENRLFLFNRSGHIIMGKLADKYILYKQNYSNDRKLYEKSRAAFPKSMPGYDRYSIDLDKRDNENRYEVEVIVGKTDFFDCNNHMLSGRFDKKTVQGYGYDYYVFRSDGRVASTLMACPDNSKKEQFIYQSKKVRYNSRLPIIVFAPKGFQVKFNIWSAGKHNMNALQE